MFWCGLGFLISVHVFFCHTLQKAFSKALVMSDVLSACEQCRILTENILKYFPENISETVVFQM